MTSDNALKAALPNVPYKIDVKQGRKYLWCSCGLSSKQPLCDGSHIRTEFKPLIYSPPEDLTVVLCGCKQTRNPPYCDGEHTRCREEARAKQAG